MNHNSLEYFTLHLPQTLSLFKRSFFISLFIYLFVAALGLHYYGGLSLAVVSRGYSPVAMLGLLPVVA